LVTPTGTRTVYERNDVTEQALTSTEVLDLMTALSGAPTEVVFNGIVYTVYDSADSSDLAGLNYMLSFINDTCGGGGEISAEPLVDTFTLSFGGGGGIVTETTFLATQCTAEGTPLAVSGALSAFLSTDGMSLFIPYAAGATVPSGIYTRN
jgi:hypothetical protein